MTMIALVHAGDRANHRGRRVIIMGPAPFLRERRWIVRYRSMDLSRGKVLLRWRSETAPESSLSHLATPVFTLGERVRVGFSPFQQKATITGIDLSGDRPLYAIEFPEEIRKTKEGTGWIREAGPAVVGAEHLTWTPEE